MVKTPDIVGGLPNIYPKTAEAILVLHEYATWHFLYLPGWTLRFSDEYWPRIFREELTCWSNYEIVRSKFLVVIAVKGLVQTSSISSRNREDMVSSWFDDVAG